MLKPTKMDHQGSDFEFPLSTFILKLESEGFKISPNLHVSIQKVLKEFGKNFKKRPMALKQILCPLIAKKRSDQDKFNRIYDNYYYEIHEKSLEIVEKLERTIPPNISKMDEFHLKNIKQQKKHFPLWILSIFCIITISILIFLLQSQETITPVAFSGINEIAPNQVTTIKEKTNIEDEEIIAMLFIIAPFILLFLDIMAESIVFSMKISKIEKYREKSSKFSGTPPYFITFPDQHGKIEFSNDLFEIANAMRQRTQSQIYRLDISKSISTTIHSGGFPEIEFRQSSRPSEYLILIKKQGLFNQQAKLFEYLMNLFENEDIFIEKFFFDKDPRRCWNIDFPNGISIHELYNKFPNHRFLIFDNGACMINSSKTCLENWVMPSFENWQERALITPVAVEDWGYIEYLLNAEPFVVLPADTNGLLELVKIITHTEKLEFKNLREQFESISKKSFSDYDFENIDELKDYFKGEEYLFDWICTLAIYHRLDWDITLAIGKKLEEYFYKMKILNYNNLLKITNLKWLQTGEIPLEMRKKLLSKLREKPEIFILAHQVLSEILDKISIPEDSSAFKEKKNFLKIKFMLSQKWLDNYYKWGGLFGLSVIGIYSIFLSLIGYSFVVSLIFLILNISNVLTFFVLNLFLKKGDVIANE